MGIHKSDRKNTSMRECLGRRTDKEKMEASTKETRSLGLEKRIRYLVWRVLYFPNICAYKQVIYFVLGRSVAICVLDEDKKILRFMHCLLIRLPRS